MQPYKTYTLVDDLVRIDKELRGRVMSYETLYDLVRVDKDLRGRAMSYETL